MKLKLDDNGNVVLQDGKPVYVYEDGKEIAFDAPAAMAKISELNEEGKKRRLKIKEYEEKLKTFDGIDDVEAAKKALETVKNLDEKKLIDAGKVEELKKQYAEQVEEKEKALKKAFEDEIESLKGQLKEKDTSIFQMMVSEKFQTSPWFSGENKKTTLFPELAASYFGKNFKVENQNGKLRVIGYDDNGEMILSREKIGEPADFDEAIGTLIEKHPKKHEILKGQPGGGPGISGSEHIPGKTIRRGDMEAFSKHINDIASGKIKVI